MAQKKQSTKQKRLKKALPVLGIAGVSFSLVGGATASASAPTADIPSQNTSPRQEIFLSEEELSDVSLATFYVFDKENTAMPQAGQQLAWWRAAAAADAAASMRRMRLARLRRLRRLRRLLLVHRTLPRLLRRHHVPTTSIDISCHGRVLLDPAHFAFFAACARAAGAVNSVDKRRRAS